MSIPKKLNDMRGKKLGQESAFAASSIKNINREPTVVYTDGMSKRLLIAKDIACAIISSNNPMYLVNGRRDDDGWHEPISITKASFEFADEILKQEDL